jgi:nicotinamidase-related amidase
MPLLTPYVPLTRDNAAVLLVDHQVGLFTGVRDVDALTHNVVALARAARILGVPTVVTSTAREGMRGPTIPELAAVVDEGSIIDRSSVNAWDDLRVVAAIKASAATKLIVAGVSLEVCAAFPAISALGEGFESYVAVDASGTFSQAKREAGLLRLHSAGIVLTDCATPMVEILGDNASPLAGEVYDALHMPFGQGRDELGGR